MSRKHKKHEHVNHERWLVSYADFITLLFAFFVVLFASGQADKKKQQRFASAMNQAFSQMALFEPHSKQPALNESSGPNPDTAPKPVELPMETGSVGNARSRPTTSLEEQVQQLIHQQVSRGRMHADAITVRSTPEGVVVSLHEAGFFDSGSAQVRPSALDALSEVIAQLPAGGVRVEGHTDNQPIHSALYASNWELSTARASAIARLLLEHSHADPATLAVAGYAEFHPIATNATAEGRAQNRRVDIVLLAKPQAQDSQLKTHDSKQNQPEAGKLTTDR